MPQKETLGQLLNIHFYISYIDEFDTDLHNFGSLN